MEQHISGRACLSAILSRESDFTHTEFPTFLTDKNMALAEALVLLFTVTAADDALSTKTHQPIVGVQVPTLKVQPKHERSQTQTLSNLDNLTPSKVAVAQQGRLRRQGALARASHPTALLNLKVTVLLAQEVLNDLFFRVLYFRFVNRGLFLHTSRSPVLGCLSENSQHCVQFGLAQ